MPERLEIATDRIAIAVIPEYGGKMVSFRSLKPDCEFLAPPARGERVPVKGPYLDADAYGFDEMFPSLYECDYPEDPWKGVHIADHGDVWYAKWEAKSDAKSITLNYNDPRFGCRLTKRIHFPSADTARIDYTLDNPTPHPFLHLWAAHLLTPLTPDIRVQLPEGTLFGKTEGFGDFDFVKEATPAGLPYLRDVSLFKTGTACKYISIGRVTEGRCDWHDLKTGAGFELRWPVDVVPYLGLWYNRGGWPSAGNGLHHMGIEPTMSPTDVLPDHAGNKNAWLNGGQKKIWRVELALI